MVKHLQQLQIMQHLQLSNANTKVGDYTLTPVGGSAKNYTFKYVSGILNIVAPPSENISASVSPTSYNYDGTAKEPVASVYDGSAEFVLDIDYTVSYENNVNAGTATATITLQGNYSGTLVREFTINKISMAATVDIANWTYG